MIDVAVVAVALVLLARLTSAALVLLAVLQFSVVACISVRL